MDGRDYVFGDIAKPEFRFEDSLGVGIDNATGEIFWQRLSDRQYLVAGLWQVSRATSVMIEVVDQVNSKGVWVFPFDTTIDSALTEDDYVGEAVDTSGISVNTHEFFNMEVGGLLATISPEVKRMLGLLHENIVFDPVTYDENDRLTLADIRIYDSPANAVNDNGVLGLVAKYQQISTYTATGNLTFLRTVKV